MLSEFKDIQEKFNDVITYSQNIEKPMTDDLFERWYMSKERYIKLWKYQLIYEFPETVSFGLEEEDKRQRVNSFIELVEFKYNNTKLANFIEKEQDGFYKNEVVEKYEDIPVGMKLVKAFKFFVEDSKELETIQQAASMIIQEDKISGKLCLSVHPLDYLSISENASNWQSCHSLDGDYRSGNLSYMTDTSTVICYLKSDEDKKLPHFPDSVPWNSKKWRVLFFFSEQMEMVFASRQYPFNSITAVNFIKKEVFPKAGFYEWHPWKRDYIKQRDGVYLYSPYIRVGEGLVSMKDLVGSHGKKVLQYNDLLYSSTYTSPMYAFKKRRRIVISDLDFDFGEDLSDAHCADFRTISFNIGEECTCLNCGKKRITMSESMMCNECELKYGNVENDLIGICPNCGERFFYDEGVWIEEEEHQICRKCADNFTQCCAQCGDIHYEDDMIYDEQNEEYVCKQCWKEMEEME